MSWLLEDFPNFVIFGCFELRVDTDAAVPVGVVGVVVDDARAEAKEIRGVDAFALFLVVGFSVAVACDPPLHQGQLRAVVGFPYTWLDIHLPWVDFQPLVRNPTSGW